VCALLRNDCADNSGITVRITPESLCGLVRILQGLVRRKIFTTKVTKGHEEYIRFMIILYTKELQRFVRFLSFKPEVSNNRTKSLF
jgi:hypothetical protein